MKELIKTLKQLGANKEYISNVEKQSLNCTISFNYDKSLTWDLSKHSIKFQEFQKRKYEDEIKQIEDIFKKYISEGGGRLTLGQFASHKYCKQLIEGDEKEIKLFYDLFYEKIEERLLVFNYYLDTRNHNLIAVPDDKLKLKVTGPIEKKVKNFLTGEDEIVYEYKFIGVVEIKLKNKED